MPVSFRSHSGTGIIPAPTSYRSRSRMIPEWLQSHTGIIPVSCKRSLSPTQEAQILPSATPDFASFPASQTAPALGHAPSNPPWYDTNTCPVFLALTAILRALLGRTKPTGPDRVRTPIRLPAGSGEAAEGEGSEGALAPRPLPAASSPRLLHHQRARRCTATARQDGGAPAG